MKSIGDRMKENYESTTDVRLTRRVPVIVRVDGRCCHSLKLDKPFDYHFMKCMVLAARSLAKEMQGFKLGYVQSDEASFLLTDYDTLNTEAWFNYELRKLCSISAAIMTERFLLNFDQRCVFDARAFNVPKEEVANYFLWRAQDWERNSIQMLAQAHFSPKQLHGKTGPMIHEMLHEIGINWAALSLLEKNGTWITRHGDHDDIIPSYREVAALVDPLINGSEE